MRIECRKHVYLLINCVFSPRILKESSRAIMIVCGVCLFVCLLLLFVAPPCPPMISLNGWRYDFDKNKKNSPQWIDVQHRKEYFENNHFLACGVILSRKLTFCLSPHDFSERLKIWNFDENKKVLSRWVDVHRKNKIRKSHFFGLWGFF